MDDQAEDHALNERQSRQREGARQERARLNAKRIEGLERVVTAARRYIHSGEDHRQETYTVWRETYRDVFGDWPNGF